MSSVPDRIGQREVLEVSRQVGLGLESASKKHTYDQILKSTTLVGGSSVLNIIIGMIRSKAMAAVLGPAGFGLAGVYGSVLNLTQSIAGMGINSSGVRQIAESAASGDAERIARTAAVLRRTSILLGMVGCIFLILFSGQVSALTFGSPGHSRDISLLSLAVFLQLISAGQGALIQGMRRITDLAKMGVLGALFGTFITIPMLYFFGQQGVVPSLVGVAVMSLITSWWYSRKIIPATPRITALQVGCEAADLLKLGFAFMVTGLMTLGSAYVVRVILLQRLGFEATGLYQSAWTLGGLYVGFILQAMGADFYPRLTARAKDDDTCNRLVNEQARVGLLLAGPGVIITLTFASVVIPLFYSTRFVGAVGILRWICLGTTLQVISWPLGFIIVAKNERVLFVAIDLLWSVVHIGLAWICVRYFGLDGSGIAFFASYSVHLFLVYTVVRYRTEFRWSPGNIQMLLVFVPLIAAAFCASYWLPSIPAACVGTLAAVVSGVYSIRVLLRLVSLDLIPPPVRRLLALFALCSDRRLMAK